MTYIQELDNTQWLTLLVDYSIKVATCRERAQNTTLKEYINQSAVYSSSIKDASYCGSFRSYSGAERTNSSPTSSGLLWKSSSPDSKPLIE